MHLALYIPICAYILFHFHTKSFAFDIVECRLVLAWTRVCMCMCVSILNLHSSWQNKTQI